MCPLLFNHSYDLWQLWTLQGCSPFGIFKILNDGWMECITCVAFIWTVFSKLVFLSFQFRFPWGLAISNSNSQTEREPHLLFWILHFPILTWCKATSLPTTLEPRIQLLQMMIRCCLWLRLADIAKSHPMKMYWPRWNPWQGAERIP